MEIKRIIVSRTDKIGDLVLSIPSFFMLRQMYPEAEITVLVRNYNYDIVKNLPYINRVVKIDDFKQKDLLEKIGYFKADVFIALYNDSFVAKLARKSGAKLRIGPYSKLNSFFAYNRGIRQKRSESKKHEAEYNLDLIRKLDKELFDKNFKIDAKIYLEEKNREAANKFYETYNIGGKVLVVNPFMGGSGKNIKDEEYCSLIKKLILKNPNLSVILTIHYSDNERGLKLKECIDSEKVHVFANMSGVLNTAAVIEKADVYFGGSTGPTHIASSLNKKIVSIYGAKKQQSIVRWGAYPHRENEISYLVPDINNPKENYSNPYFDKYNEEMEDKLVEMIIEKLS